MNAYIVIRPTQRFRQQNKRAKHDEKWINLQPFQIIIDFIHGNQLNHCIYNS